MSNHDECLQPDQETAANPGLSRRTVLTGATAWLLYTVAENRTTKAWAAGQDGGAKPMAGNPKFAEEATRLAIESVEKGWGGPFGAVIVKDGAIIGRGQNRVLLTGCPVYHAEVTAIIDASAKLNPKALLGSDYHAGTIS